MQEQPPKTSKKCLLGVLRNKSNDTNISVRIGSAPPAYFGTGHVTVLSAPPWKVEYTGIL